MMMIWDLDGQTLLSYLGKCSISIIHLLDRDTINNWQKCANNLLN